MLTFRPNSLYYVIDRQTQRLRPAEICVNKHQRLPQVTSQAGNNASIAAGSLAEDETHA